MATEQLSFETLGLDISRQRIAGLDEVGRGPLAGPVLAAAVILDASRPIEGLRDSKKLTALKREALAETIKEQAAAWSFGWASVEEIDTYNILQATFLAMVRAVEGLSIRPDHVFVDGNQSPPLKVPCTPIIKGDDKVLEISAASIIAKVERDRYMQEMDQAYPGYGFADHAGYPTPLHLEQLQCLGVSPIHRRSFKPVRRRLELEG
ncbi:MAG: ribonuclease HII [Hahellaceae bacterium]|nr:ribonuclease HII [Hahellaceae bacterium]